MLWNTADHDPRDRARRRRFSFLISVAVVRSRFWGSRLLDQLAFLPHAIPGMVMGLALFWIFLQIDKLGTSLLGSLSWVIIAFVIGYISFGTRVMNGAVLQIHKDLEEAAKMSGATQWRVFRRVFVPLLQPAFVGVAIWTILHVVALRGQTPDPDQRRGQRGDRGDDLELVGPRLHRIGGRNRHPVDVVLLAATLLIRRFGFGPIVAVP